MLEVYIGSFSRWIFTSLVILTLLQFCESISWTKQPAKPFILVVGVNNTNQTLSWLYSIGSDETVQNIQFERSKPGGSEERIASRLPNSGFSLKKEEYKNEYIAKLENDLVLLNVNNDEEFVYEITVTYAKGSDVFYFEDKVQVIVKVPPRITVFRERQSKVAIGKNLTLTCNASGDPHPNITWSKGGLTAAQFTATGVLLHLVHVQRQDVGSYKCTADNGYGTPATNLAVVSVKCPPKQCDNQTYEVGITINDNQWPWKTAYTNRGSIEFKMLESNLTSAIASVYTKNPAKKFYEQTVRSFRSGSIVAHLQLLFGNGSVNALVPLEDELRKGKLGPFTVDRQLVRDPTTPPPTTPTVTTSTGKTGGPDVGARGSGSELSDAEMWGIIGACIAVVVIVAIVILVIFCRKKRKGGGASKGKQTYSEADGYRMNRQPPPSGLGTASPAYVEARMYAPANATSKQDDQPPPFNYAELSHDNVSSKPPPPRYSTEYSEVSPQKRPQQGEGGGFELWC